MDHSTLGSYSTSSAQSPTHYRLVQQLEQATTVEEHHQILLRCLEGLRASWKRRQPKPSKARHDLVLLLYCRQQRLASNQNNAAQRAARESEAAWALPTAVMLAGAGNGSLKDRQIGYRASAELFTTKTHPLKMLLINTIQSDLYTHPLTAGAEARYSLALRAIAAPTLVSPELLSAVRERVLEMLSSHGFSEPTRRLALEALLSLVRVTQGSLPATEPSSLILESRRAVLTLLLPPPPSSPSSSSSTSSKRRSRRSSPSPPSLNLLAGLSSAVVPSSPIYPVLPTELDCLRIQLAILREVLDFPPEGTHAERPGWHGTRGRWAVAKVLDALRAELEGHAAVQEERLGNVKDEVEKVVWQVVDGLLSCEGELPTALLFSALRLLPYLPTPSAPVSASTLSRLLSHIHISLLHPTSSTVQLFALRSLALLPPSSWAFQPEDSDPNNDSKGKGKGRATPGATNEWGESAWRAILSGLDSPDSSLRKATLALLAKVDSGLVKLHYDRLLASLSLTDGGSEVSTVSLAYSTATVRSKKMKREVLERLLETLPFPPPSASAPVLPASTAATPRAESTSSLPPPTALLNLLDSLSSRLSLPTNAVLPELLLPVLDVFTYEEDETKRGAFARELLKADEGKAWKKSVMAGLWVAGTVHALVGGTEEGDDEIVEAMDGLAKWLANEDGSAPSDLLPLLSEPFLFALLRLVSLSSDPSPAVLASLHSHLSVAASSASPDVVQLFELVLSATSPQPSTAIKAALAVSGRETRRKTLAEFSEALLSALDPARTVESTSDAYHDYPSSPSTAQSGFEPNPSASPALHCSYPPSSSSPSSISSSPLSPHSLAPLSPPSASSTAAARAREQRDLLRERADRGGTGVRGNETIGVQSSMGAQEGEHTELGLLMEGMAIGESGQEKEGDGDEEEREFARGASTPRAAGRIGPVGVREMGRTREDSGTSEEGEPPNELLLNLSPTSSDLLDPFRAY
ncbi:hypothetical protein JCM11641_000280 [Rhodosporidiobolus odoratus]